MYKMVFNAILQLKDVLFHLKRSEDRFLYFIIGNVFNLLTFHVKVIDP